MNNTLFYGDCLDILKGYDQKGSRYIKDESVDLIYLDPPFNSDRIYNVIFKEPNGKEAASQIKGFDDTWTWTDNVAKEYEDLKMKGGKIADTMVGLERILGFNNMFAYLVMMASRLIEMRRVLKSTGSIYLHVDQTAGHYIKIILDAIFGPNNFRNEIVWCYGGGGVPKGAFARKHDNIFFYSKGESCKFNQQYVPYKKHSPFHSKGEPYREQGKVMEDYWLIEGLGSTSQEKMGYPTQKPERLLEIIVKAGSDEGDVVCDPFAGCGTTLAVAQRLNRKWIGIDITALAINILKHRLGPDAVYQVIGEPKSPEDAARLASEDAWQFQLWVLGLDKARPANGIKKGGDKGIDGKRFFKIGDKTEMIIYSVKSGKIGPRDVRDLKGTVESNGAAIGVLLCMGPLTREMREEAAKGGLYRPGPLSETYPKIQIFTVEELMIGGKSVQWPRYSKDVTMPEVQRKDKEEEPSKNLVDFA